MRIVCLFLLNFTNESDNVLIMCVSLQNQPKTKFMTKKEEDELARWMQGKDVTEVLAILMRSGNRYNRRILKFFKWFCKYVPVVIMLTHMYGMIKFARHPMEMVITFKGNEPCYIFIYIMVYVLPMFIILASRFFWLCWRYRIPFFYYFGVNAIHICYGSIFTTNDMVMAEYSLMLMTALFYAYGFVELFLGSKCGKHIFS